MIKIEKMTIKYPNGRGVFDIDFAVEKGECVGFLGPNGAGKTTTIRCLLGFLRPLAGNCTIDAQNCFEHSPEICKKIGYIAGEPAFPDGMSGMEYLNFIQNMRGITDRKRMEELVKYFDFDPRGKIKRMSKGMKQKTAIVAAFMHDPEIYIFDEPTSGLDPIMQIKFIELMKREKAKGKTILLSTHMIGEIKSTADRMQIIRVGRIVKEMGKTEIEKTNLEKIVYEYYVDEQNGGTI